MYIVLVTEGKRESVDSAFIRLFATEEAATTFVEEIRDVGKKYWIKAEIVPEGVEIELVDGYYDYSGLR